MFKDLFKRQYFLERLTKGHPKYSVSYKILGMLDPSKDKYLVKDNIEIPYQKASIKLCVRAPFGGDDIYTVWQSDNYDSDEATIILEAECLKISKLVDRRIEIWDYDWDVTEEDEAAPFIIKKVYNENQRIYLVAATDLG